jgi:probable F420-dependent oxidoreductase
MSVGIWTYTFDGQPMPRVREAAAEIEELGFDTLWFGEAFGREAYTQAGLLLAATRRITVATGIANIYRRDPYAIAAAERTLAEAYPGRFLNGLGGHRVGSRRVLAIDAVRDDGRPPVTHLREYLDALDAARPGVEPAAPARRVLAALGPKTLALAAERTDGAHPYFVPVEHTVGAREIVGAKAFLAVEQAAVLDRDPARAREIAHAHVAGYLRQAEHQRANLRRLGFTDDDLAGDGSDRLVEALVAFGGERAVADRIRAHLDAGADHVCVQVLTGDDRLPLEEWRRLADLVS